MGKKGERMGIGEILQERRGKIILVFPHNLRQK